MDKIQKLEKSRCLPYVAAVLVFVLGLVYVGITAVGHVPDVWEHVYRVSAILNGDVMPVHVDSTSNFHDSTENVGGYVDWDWVDLSIEEDDGYDLGVVYRDTITDFDENGAYVPFSNTAMNTPVAYLPQLAAFALGRVLGLPALIKYYLAEIFMLLVYAFSCGMAVRLVPRNKIVMLVVCLLPPLAYRYSFAISADSMTQAMCLIYVACAYRGYCSPTLQKGLACGLVASGFLVALTKITYMPLIALSLVVLAHHRRSISRGLQVFLAVGTVVSGLCTVAVMQLNGWYVTTPAIMSTLDVAEKKAALLSNPLWAISDICYSIITMQGNNAENGMAMLVVWAVFAVALVIMLAAFAKARKRGRARTQKSAAASRATADSMLVASRGDMRFWLLAFALSVLVMLLVYLALWLQYTTADTVGVAGMQFRYANPLMPIMVLGAADGLRVLCGKG